MSDMSYIFPEVKGTVPRALKEEILGQRGLVVWLFGLSGSGKSTIAKALEHILYEEGRYTILLDADNIRSGMNCDLGFKTEDRRENIRRIAYMAREMARNGAIVIVTAITPLEELRILASTVIGLQDIVRVYVKASQVLCMQRDVKGLYKAAGDGDVKHFTGVTHPFERPGICDIVLDTETTGLKHCVEKLHKELLQRYVRLQSQPLETA